jgi:cobalamin-dependent methionine synthase I
VVNISVIKIPYTKLLSRLGYFQNKTKIDEKIACSIKENLSLAQKLIKPKSAIVSEEIKVSENLTSFENGYKIRSSYIAVLLKNCFKAYGVSATISNALEKKRDECLRKKEIFNALILDAAGSVAVEETIAFVNMQIKTFEERNGNTLTVRYSPGYGDWTLDANKQFLDWISAEEIGITLNESYHMRPEKSVSALIGVKKEFKLKEQNQKYKKS